jgi:hypothetical protein
MDNEVKVTLTFTVNELNAILAGLGKLPFEVVDSFIKRIVSEAEAQIKSQPSEILPEVETKQAA